MVSNLMLMPERVSSKLWVETANKLARWPLKSVKCAPHRYQNRIRYQGEEVKLKAGKSGKTASRVNGKEIRNQARLHRAQRRKKILARRKTAHERFSKHQRNLRSVIDDHSGTTLLGIECGPGAPPWKVK